MVESEELREKINLLKVRISKPKTLNPKLLGDVAQLGERLACTEEVAGSIPVISNF